MAVLGKNVQVKWKVRIKDLIPPIVPSDVNLTGNKGNYICDRHLEVNYLRNDKFLDRSKLKAFADDKMHLTTEFFGGIGRKHCGKRRKC